MHKSQEALFEHKEDDCYKVIMLNSSLWDSLDNKNKKEYLKKYILDTKELLKQSKQESHYLKSCIKNAKKTLSELS